MKSIEVNLPEDRSNSVSDESSNVFFCGSASYEYSGKRTFHWLTNSIWSTGHSLNQDGFAFTFTRNSGHDMAIFYEGNHIGYLDEESLGEADETTSTVAPKWIATSVTNGYMYVGNNLAEASIKLLKGRRA